MKGLVLAALVAALALPAAALAQQRSAVQFSLDGKRVLINKNVNGDRWVITQNVDDGSLTGNVFFQQGDPAFLWCSFDGSDFQPNPLLRNNFYTCYGSNRCRALPCIPDEDWDEIGPVTLRGDFLLPPVESCDVAVLTNGATQTAPTSRWSCTGGNPGSFFWQLFADGNGFSTATGSFTFTQTSCAFGQGTSQGQAQALFLSGSRDRGKLLLRRILQSGQTLDSICTFLPF